MKGFASAPCFCNGLQFFCSNAATLGRTALTLYLLSILLIARPAQAGAEEMAMKVLDDYMAAVNRVDILGVTENYHFPHLRVLNGNFHIWHTPEEAMPMVSLPKSEREQLFRQSLGENWLRTDWGYRKVISSNGSTVHIATELIRINTDGDEINRFESLYIVSLKEGRWGILGRSSFAPR